MVVRNFESFVYCKLAVYVQELKDQFPADAMLPTNPVAHMSS